MIDNDQLKDQIFEELKTFKDEVTAGLATLHTRLDRQDLNHAAEYLRQFGYFLERNPSFMRRQVEREEHREEREVAVRYMTRIMHLGNWKQKASWLALGIATGFLFALGNALFAPFGSNDWIHFLIHSLGGK